MRSTAEPCLSAGVIRLWPDRRRRVSQATTCRHAILEPGLIEPPPVKPVRYPRAAWQPWRACPGGRGSRSNDAAGPALRQTCLIAAVSRSPPAGLPSRYIAIGSPPPRAGQATFASFGPHGETSLRSAGFPPAGRLPLVFGAGFEPATPRSMAWCSCQLS